MKISLSASWKTVALAEAVFIVLLGLAFLRSPFDKESTTTTRDSTRSVQKDTTNKTIDFGFVWSNPQPSDTLQAPDTSTTTAKSAQPAENLSGETEKGSQTSCGDTTTVRVSPAVLTYTRSVNKPDVSGTITSTVEGELLRQNVSLSVTQPVVRTRIRDRISTKTVKVRRDRFQLLGAGGTRIQQLSVDLTLGGGFRLPGIGSVVYQHGLMTGSHQVVFTRPILSL